jgi:hypothetical protein
VSVSIVSLWHTLILTRKNVIAVHQKSHQNVHRVEIYRSVSFLKQFAEKKLVGRFVDLYAPALLKSNLRDLVLAIRFYI